MDNHLVIGLGGPNDNKSLPLATRRGTHIPNRPRLEQNPIQRQAAIALWREHRPEAKLRSSTAVYNCMGLVFASRRTHVDIDQLLLILREDGYHRLQKQEQLEVGDVVVYGKSEQELTHVGFVMEIQPDIEQARKSITVLSKWGSDGEYLHKIDYVPEAYGKPVQYWTDRKR